jgi:DNA-directed RNA polymerase subunit M/transcription elongation factor TFIIS
MPLATCPRCKTLFQKEGSQSVCPKCVESEDADYEKVRAALEDKPSQSAEQVAEETGVDLNCVLRLLDSGRIETTAANVGVKCGQCGAPAISISKRLCEGCLQKLNAKLAIEQAKIKLPKKRGVDVGTALNVPDSMAAKREAGVRRKNLMRREDD